MMALVMLATLVAPQDKTAEEAWKKIQESIEKSKTVSVKFRSELATTNEGQDVKLTASGSVRLKEGNRVSLVFRGFGGIVDETRVVSSGTSMKLAMSFRAETREGIMDAPTDLAANLARGFSRVGAAWSLGALLTPVGHGEVPIHKGVPDLAQQTEITELKSGKAEGSDLTLTYTLKDKSPAAPSIACKIWYQPKTFKVVKRTMSVKMGPRDATVVETYEEFAVNGEIPDADFALPEPKGERALRTLLGHPSQVDCLAFSPDGKTLASADFNRIKLWDVAGGKELRTLPSNGTMFGALAFSPDGKTIAAGGHYSAGPFQDERGWSGAILWEIETGKELRILKGSRTNVSAIAFSPDGSTLACGGFPFILWDVPSGKELRSLQAQGGGGPGVAFSPDLRRVSGQGNNAIRIWDLATDREFRSLPLGEGYPSGAAFSPDGKLLAVGTGDGKVRVWDMESGVEQWVAAAHEKIAKVAFSPDGKILASAGGESIKLWEVSGGKEVRVLSGHRGGVSVVLFSPDGKTLASGGSGSVKLWDTHLPAIARPAPARTSPAVREGLIGRWTFDEGAETRAEDSSGVGNPGTLRNGAAWGKGHEGQAVKLDGARAFVNLDGGDRLNFGYGAPFTIAAWIETSRECGTIVSFRNSATDGAVIDLTVGFDGVQTSAGALMAMVRQDRGSRGFARVTGGPVNDGKWHAVALTRSKDGTIELFLDGASQGTNKGGESAGPITTDLRVLGCERYWVQIGRKPDPEHEYFQGSLDDVRIYSRALSAEEVAALAGAKVPVAAAPDTRPWRPIFDGKTTDFMNPFSSKEWKVENGSLQLVPGSRDSGQSRESFGEGDIRVRFEVKDVPYGVIAVRQGEGGRYSFLIDRAVSTALGGGTHEIVFTCRGDDVKATLDGKPAPLQAEGGRPKSGVIQFGGAQGLRILAIDYRELPK